MNAAADGSWVAVGAHRGAEDIAGEGIATFESGPLFISAIRIEPPLSVASREVLLSAVNARQELLQTATFVAIRHGMTFRNGGELDTKVAGRLAAWQKTLEKHRGKVEVTLKIAGESAPPRPSRSDYPGGGDYLRALHDAKKKRKVPADVRMAAEELLGPRAVSWKWIARADGASELVLLVRRESFGEVRDAALILRDRIPHVPFLLSGPWPLETFIDEE